MPPRTPRETPPNTSQGQEHEPEPRQDQAPGGPALRRRRLEIHPTVFWGAAGVILLFVTFSLVFLRHMSRIFSFAQAAVSANAGWFYAVCVNVFLLFSVYLLFSRMGSIRLGGRDTQPEFTYGSWLAMLFSAGMGIGLVYYSVAEPIIHFGSPPTGEGGTIEASRLSMSLTMLHWGLHCWAVYSLVGLALAYFCFTRGLPLTISSALYPLLGRRVHGPVGNVVDILAAVATLFGLATSLGLGVQQINAGLNHLFGWRESVTLQIVLIAVITSFATISVVLGLDRGIRRLSVLNMILASMLLLFVLLVGPTWYLLLSFMGNLWEYLKDLPQLAIRTGEYRPRTGQLDWSTFYWGWWIAWSPFVGMFIARISRGRTVREFLLGVVLVPALITIAWLTVFGNAALYVELFGQGGIAEAVEANIAVALFVLFEHFPLASLTTMLGVIVIVIFFVSSSDSASLVVDIITAGGNTDPPVKQRIFWATMEGVVAAVLLLGGGLQALQAASMTSGLPFAVVLLLLAVSLFMGLREEWLRSYRSSS